MEKGKEIAKEVNTDKNNMPKNKKTTRKKVKKTTKKTPSIEIENTEVVSYDLDGKFLLVKVGDETSPASTEQIKAVQDELVELFEKNNINCAAFVTHHLVSMEIIGRH